MRCINCKEEIPDGTEICPYCGTEQPKDNSGKDKKVKEEDAGKKDNEGGGSGDGPKPNKKIIIAAGAGCAALILVLALTVFSKGGSSSGSSSGGSAAGDNSEYTAAAEEPKAEEEPAPAEDTKPEEEPAPAEDTKPAEEPVPAEDSKPEEEPAPAEDTKPAEEPTPAEDTKPADDSQSGEQSSRQYFIPENALYYEGHHYYIYKDIKTNWDDVTDSCIERGGYPAVINDKAENDKLYHYMVSMGYDQAFFGLVYDTDSAQWIYKLGDSSDFRDWGSNSRGEKEPNNSGGSEFNVEMDVNMIDGYWNDAEFGAKTYTPDGDPYKDIYAYICEWDQ